MVGCEQSQGNIRHRRWWLHEVGRVREINRSIWNNTRVVRVAGLQQTPADYGRDARGHHLMILGDNDRTFALGTERLVPEGT